MQLLRVAFVSAAIFALVMAILPQPPRLPGDPSDKTLHILAFAVLAALGCLAFPRMRLLILILGLAAFGAVIELVQAIPVLHRDSQLADLVADVVAVVLVALPLRWAQHRIQRR